MNMHLELKKEQNISTTKAEQLHLILSNWWTHLAGQARLIESLVRSNKLSVTQQRHGELGCYTDLKMHSRRREHLKNPKVKLPTYHHQLPSRGLDLYHDMVFFFVLFPVII